MVPESERFWTGCTLEVTELDKTHYVADLNQDYQGFNFPWHSGPSLDPFAPTDEVASGL